MVSMTAKDSKGITMVVGIAIVKFSLLPETTSRESTQIRCMISLIQANEDDDGGNQACLWASKAPSWNDLDKYEVGFEQADRIANLTGRGLVALGDRLDPEVRETAGRALQRYGQTSRRFHNVTDNLDKVGNAIKDVGYELCCGGLSLYKEILAKTG